MIRLLFLLYSSYALASGPELVSTTNKPEQAVGLENCATLLVHRALAETKSYPQEQVDVDNSHIAMAVSTPLNWYLRIFYFETANYKGWAYLGQTSKRFIQDGQWVDYYTCSFMRTVWGGPNFQLQDRDTNEVLAEGYAPRG